MSAKQESGSSRNRGDAPRIVSVSVLALSALLGWDSAIGQTTTGVPGSPSATTTIDGKYLPPPPAPFGGIINLNSDDSKPYWPPTVVPPKGAPNILLIMTDDQGYGVTSTFGGVVPTPAMDRVAQAGLRYTQFHSTALCSPTRAALITGRNHHSVGFGVIGEMSTGFPVMTLSSVRKMPLSAGFCNKTDLPRRGSARSTILRAFNTVWPGLSINGRAAWASTISTDSWEARPISGRLTFFAITPRSFRGLASPGTT